MTKIMTVLQLKQDGSEIAFLQEVAALALGLVVLVMGWT